MILDAHANLLIYRDVTLNKPVNIQETNGRSVTEGLPE